MEKRIINDEIEKYLYYNNFDKTLEFINNKYKVNNQCILLTKYSLSSYYNDLPINEYYKIIYIENGNCTVEINDNNYTLEAGDILLIPPHINYILSNFKHVETKFITIILPKKYIQQFNTTLSDLLSIFNKVQTLNNFHIKVRTTFKTRINSSFSMLEEFFLSNDYGDDILFKATIAALITRMNKGVTFYDVDSHYVSYTLIIEKINTYINNNIDKKLLISDIAKSIGLSESRISHIYKENMGIGINQYIIKKRLSIAKEMLKLGTSLSEVTIRCGFQDYSSFLRSFKKAYDITPKAYQNSYYKN